MMFCVSHNFQGPYFILGFPPRINLLCWSFGGGPCIFIKNSRTVFQTQASLGLAPGERPKTSESCAYLLSFLCMTICVSIDSKVYVHILSICKQNINKYIHIIHKYMVMQCIYVYVLFLLLFRKPSKSVVP